MSNERTHSPTQTVSSDSDEEKKAHLSGDDADSQKPTTEKELIGFCKETLAGFKVPKQVVFCELPKTSTGKIQKFEFKDIKCH